MDIRQLSYFLEIAKAGSYTQAAKKLFVSQSSLSKSMKKLRFEIGQDLFEPGSKKPVLTSAGLRLYESAERITREYEAVLSELQGPGSQYQEHISVGIPPLICTCFFAPLIAGFQSEYPGIEISIVEKGARSIQDEVDREILDVGIVILPVYEDRFDVTELLEDITVLVVSKNHPYADRSRVSYTELKHEKFILFNDEYTLYHQIAANCREAGFEPYVASVSGQWDYLAELAALELGVTIMPRPIFNRNMRDDIRLIPIDHPAAAWTVVAIIKKDRIKQFAANKFVSYVASHIIPN